MPRASFTPDEICELTIEFYRRNYIEGLFLSSGILRSPDYTMELICAALEKLREVYRFQGYIHVKAIPGASAELIRRAGFLAVPDECEFGTCLRPKGLRTLAPHKDRRDRFLTPMRLVQNGSSRSNAGGTESIPAATPSVCAGRTEHADDRRRDAGDGLSDAACGGDRLYQAV